jgi:hypothetical protein
MNGLPGVAVWLVLRRDAPLGTIVTHNLTLRAGAFLPGWTPHRLLTPDRRPQVIEVKAVLLTTVD